jgi:1-deoxy-D-xylulose-5-phosphate reductoisomerase
LRQGGGAPTILNAANEAAVHAFLSREIGFRDIVRVVERTLELLPHRELGELSDVHDLDREARLVAARLFGSRANAVAV